MKKIILLLGASYLTGAIAAEEPTNTATNKKVPTSTATNKKVSTPPAAEQTKEMPAMTVTDKIDSEDGRPEKVSKTNFTTPLTKVTKKDMAKTNGVTTADAVKYESGIFVRQRYIGDPNAPIGMRGSNPYQAARVMVFMDGTPIWNPLQSSYNGSPRWGLVSPGEIKSVDVLGGPFSSEYSGNAMGGVINFNTMMPQKRQIYTEATYMLQPYDRQGTDANLQGFKTFGSYGDKFDDLSVYFSTNHLENEGQPMTPTTLTSLTPASAKITPLFGAITQLNPKGNGIGGAAGTPMLQIGSDGIYHSTDDLLKWKGLYDINKDLNTSLLIAYENLTVTHNGQSFLTNSSGQPMWGSQLSNYSANGYKLSNSTALGSSNQNRETVTLGWGLNGKLWGNWNTNTNISYFDILKYTTIASSYNSNDPITQTAAGLSGTNTSWKNSGWVNVSSKFDNQEFLGRKDLSFSGGYEYQHAKMLQTVSNLSNFASGAVTATATNPQGINTQSGGVLDTHGLFGQFSWRFLPTWDLTAGTRWEHWAMSDGTYLTSTNMTGSLNPQSRHQNAWSPKASIGFEPRNWKFRYSFGKAWRFPVADELFGNAASVNGSVTLANSTLKPESGLHHNFLAEYDFDDGYIRLNLFHENVRNAIYSQYIYTSPNAPLSSVMSSIGEVETNGLDISGNRSRIMGYPVDLKINSTILNSKIISNPLNPAVVGNQMPLMPHYRVNALTTYHYGNDWDFSVGTRYQSKMNSQPDNKDLQLPYYGAFTESFYVDLKTTYRFNNQKGHVSFGIDNVNNYQAFFNHPLPMRTFFAQIGYNWL